MKLMSDTKFCGTCLYWTGRQVPDFTRTWVEYDQNEKANCSIVRIEVPGQYPVCQYWEPRFK